MNLFFICVVLAMNELPAESAVGSVMGQLQDWFESNLAPPSLPLRSVFARTVLLPFLWSAQSSMMRKMAGYGPNKMYFRSRGLGLFAAHQALDVSLLHADRLLLHRLCHSIASQQRSEDPDAVPSISRVSSWAVSLLVLRGASFALRAYSWRLLLGAALPASSKVTLRPFWSVWQAAVLAAFSKMFLSVYPYPKSVAPLLKWSMPTLVLYLLHVARVRVLLKDEGVLQSLEGMWDEEGFVGLWKALPQFVAVKIFQPTQ